MFHGFGRHFGHEGFYARRGGGRGPFGHGNPFERGEGKGPFGHGHHGGGSRFFKRGDIKFALLNLLLERPMHGYEMMKALETQSGGLYVPSAGTIYPTLQLLEDRGLVTSTVTEGKKVYQITEAGRAELAEQGEPAGFGGANEFGAFDFGKENFRHSPELHAIKGEAKELMYLMVTAVRLVLHNPAKLPQFREILQQTRRSLQAMIYGTSVPADKPNVPADKPTDSNPAAAKDL